MCLTPRTQTPDTSFSEAALSPLSFFRESIYPWTDSSRSTVGSNLEALMEGGGTSLLSFVSIASTTSPAINVQPLTVLSFERGIFETANFVGLTVRAIMNATAISLFGFSFNVGVSGGLNPMIAIATSSALWRLFRGFCRHPNLREMDVKTGL